MLRRNFLKLCGLVPFTRAITLNKTKPTVTYGAVACKIKEEKWYAKVSRNGFEGLFVSTGYATYEVELESNCIPKKYDIAFIKRCGLASNIADNHNPILGLFVTERYQKDVLSRS